MRVFVAVALLAGFAAVPAGASARGPARAYDFNGDGKRDFVVPGNDDRVAVVYGRTLRRQAMGRASSTVSSDFDRDGYADLALERDGAVTIVYGTRGGLGRRVSALTTETPKLDRQALLNGLAVGDFDRNGRPDLVVTVDHAYWLFKNVGRGGVTASPVQVRVPQRQGYRQYGLSPYVGDFTGDGRPDLVFNVEQYEGFKEDLVLSLLFAKGGRDGLGRPVPLPYRGASRAAVVADFNGDRRADLAVSSANFDVGTMDHGVQVLYGSAKGLGRPQAITKRTAGLPGKKPEPADFGGTMAAADLDRDGRAELAVGDYTTDRVWIFKGTKKGLAVRTAAILRARAGNGWGYFAPLSLTDVIGDSRPELVTVAADCPKKRVIVYRNVKGRIVPKSPKTAAFACP